MIRGHDARLLGRQLGQVGQGMAGHTMGNTSSLQASKWDDLFQALTRPDDLKAYLVRNLNPDGTRQSALRTQASQMVDTTVQNKRLEAEVLRLREQNRLLLCESG